ncbi:MAG: SGNH/GDSL hydrolase family protein [Lachnospiraceae bacterium]|nr:SGNH/GDSL hydrolase family protein [Lachnospiraceae bacterium]
MQKTDQNQKKGKELTSRRFLRLLLLCAFVPLFLCGLLVFLFDPFYHYHRPWFGLKQVLNEKEYQVVGTLDHFDYDAVLAGSSVVENTDNRDVDNAFGCTSVKAVRSYGGMADLCWLLSRAHETHEIRLVIFNLDPSSLSAEPETTFAQTGCPMYLYDKNPVNDVRYLFNRDVLFHRIPYEIANSFSGYYNEGLSYHWAKDKTFSEDEVLYHYLRTPAVAEMQPDDLWEEQCTGNLAILAAEVEAHPETMYRFYFPPYSMLWWDNSIRTGERDAVLKNEQRAMEMLLNYQNVEVYNYQAEPEIITDLNNYMDTLHFTPQINAWIISEMAAGRGRVQKGAAEKTVEEIRSLTDSLQEKYLKQIGEAGRFHYGLSGE